MHYFPKKQKISMIHKKNITDFMIIADILLITDVLIIYSKYFVNPGYNRSLSCKFNTPQEVGRVFKSRT